MEVLDMWKEVLLESGQFLIEPTNVELDQDRFVHLVRDALRPFNKYCPKLEKFNISVVGAGTGGTFTFTDDFTANGKSLGIPKMVSDVIPLSLYGTVPLSLRHLFGNITQGAGQSMSVNRVSADLVKCPFPVDYRSPILYVPIQGDYDVECYFNHKLTEYTDSENNRQFRVDTIDESAGDFLNFFDYLTGKFMQALGRSRRAFTIADLPITLDAAELVSEGERKVEDAMSKIIENDHDFTAAW